MKHDMRDTSLLAYTDIQWSLSERESLVLNAIQVFTDSTALELANYLHFTDPNSVRPRITDLTRKGIIESSGKRPCMVSSEHRLAYTWRLKK